ncbi:MAG: peptidoglycan-binding protein [Parcubacteria group bacterium]|nr:MAG: peptidoglycan-binding protein [Parcubacteria group bacterium]
MKKYILSSIVILAVLTTFNVNGAEETVWCHDFNDNLKITMSGNEVSSLQTALFQEGLYEEKITGEFDQYTFNALIKFQEKYMKEILTPYRLTKGTGFFGKSTRAKITKLYGCALATQSTSTPLSCANYFDDICPSGCTDNSDADCCASNGKYWLKTSWNYACYDTNYGSGCIAGQMCSLVTDGCCPNWCFSDSDYDCCVQAGKCWANSQCGICPAPIKTATTTLNSTSSILKSSIATTTNATSSDCVDSDKGIDQYVYGKVVEKTYASYYDTCEGNQLKEWYCSDSGKSYKYIDCPFGCVDGVCKKSTGNSTSTKVVCSDSDGGKDYYIAGKVGHGDGFLINYDVCIDNNTIKENCCGSGYYNYEFYTCPRGCQNNACIKENIYETPTSSISSIISPKAITSTIGCTDSDNGNNYYLKGSGSGWNTNNELIKFSDTCYKDVSTNATSSCSGSYCFLAENYCEGKYVKTDLGIKCPNGCKEGGCLSATASGAQSMQDMQNQLANLFVMISQLLQKINSAK